MRKIEKEMLNAIHDKRFWEMDNTRVDYWQEIDTTERACIEHAKIYLHGNHIATWCYGLKRMDYNPVTLKTWPTRTTFSRLNALGIKSGMRKGIVYVNEKAL